MDQDIIDKMQRFDLSAKEHVETLVSDEDIEPGVQECARSLISRIVGEKWANLGGLKTTLNLIWTTRKPFAIRVLDENLFQFLFQSEEDKRKALIRKAWSFDGQYLLLKEWCKDSIDFTAHERKLELRVHILNLPLHWILEEISVKVGKIIGGQYGDCLKASFGGYGLNGDSKERKFGQPSSGEESLKALSLTSIFNLHSSKFDHLYHFLASPRRWRPPPAVDPLRLARKLRAQPCAAPPELSQKNASLYQHRRALPAQVTLAQPTSRCPVPVLASLSHAPPASPVQLRFQPICASCSSSLSSSPRIWSPPTILSRSKLCPASSDICNPSSATISIFPAKPVSSRRKNSPSELQQLPFTSSTSDPTQTARVRPGQQLHSSKI
ncbi:Unknown protein [Striga hermonthica]|uniref:DUF4283 domain-containing protein n=1 Tax=Striga hermonthica TaxID=68872 RepID=A0A9N7MH55_STRHE|nr:Unknown protein [Striga hermonthica]